jgi:DNA-binding transcriptional MerR regulator
VTSVNDRAFLSIGEVLELVKDEFPDVTISKIRFLESQGLIDPERTPSGYRKFYEGDVERLRWILRQQKDHFLPLKVIKERIGTVAPPPVVVPEEEVEKLEKVEEAVEPPAADAIARSASPLHAGLSAVSMTMLELARAASCEVAAVRELERYGLLTGTSSGTSTVYDEEALVVARTATAFARHGVEARHLRMYKTAAEREASTYEQVVLPLLKQRNPTARRQAVEALEEMARLGESLRATFVRSALRGYTDS